jgi:hypothetical protein
MLIIPVRLLELAADISDPQFTVAGATEDRFLLMLAMSHLNKDGTQAAGASKARSQYSTYREF